MIRYWKLLKIILLVVPTPLFPLIRLFSKRPKLENSFFTTTEGKKVPLKIYHPPNLDVAPAIILFPGASPAAENHEGVNLLAKALASSGVRAFLPRIPALKKVLIQSDSIEHMINAYLTVSDRKDIDSKKIVGCGVSFGGSLFIKACLDDRINGKPASIISYGSYFDFGDTLEFSITGKFSDGKKDFHLNPHDWGRTVFFYNYVRYVDEPFNMEKIEEYLYDQIINNGEKSKELWYSFSRKDKKFINTILYEKNEEAHRITKKTLMKIKPLVMSLSPSSFINKIDFPIYMMHGAQDNMIPYTETLKFARELKIRGNKVHSFISNLYSHSEIEHPKVRGINFISELFRMGKFISSMLRPVLE
ncbi:MAG: hypothetical protein CMG75_09310 [Candidatus Marinimicrobia bacterium]|nr:hypothetical protein [Candidatus Neomarinimicrobiota bacterium]|tara:strand:+ start:33728 stop:34810 length:1083 start_codon:yes stop_codon:yes gene_type:complete